MVRQFPWLWTVTATRAPRAHIQMFMPSATQIALVTLALPPLTGAMMGRSLREGAEKTNPFHTTPIFQKSKCFKVVSLLVDPN